MKNNNYIPKATVTESSLLRRVEVFLEDGDFQRADEYCERILDMNVENSSAYLYKLLAALELKSKEELSELDTPFENQPAYTKIMRFGSDELKNEISALNLSIVEKIEFKNRQFSFEKALSLKESDSISTLTEACNIFRSLGDFENAVSLLEDTEKKIEDIYDSRYNSLFTFIKDKEQEINNIRFQNSADLAERDNYDRYINDNRGKKFFDYSGLVTLCCAIIGLVAIVLLSNSFLTVAGITMRTILRCIFTRILPGIPLTVIACIISYTVSKKLVKKQKDDLMEDIGTAATRAKEIGSKINHSENASLYLQQELDNSLAAMRQLNSEFDAFTESREASCAVNDETAPQI